MKRTSDEGCAKTEGYKGEATNRSREPFAAVCEPIRHHKIMSLENHVQMPSVIYNSLGGRTVHRVKADEFEEIFGAPITLRDGHLQKRANQ